MTLLQTYVINDTSNNPTQWHFAIKEIDSEETAIIVSSMSDNEYYIAIYGFAALGNFEFKGNNNPIVNRLNKQMFKHPQALRRILKIVFDDD